MAEEITLSVSSARIAAYGTSNLGGNIQNVAEFANPTDGAIRAGIFDVTEYPNGVYYRRIYYYASAIKFGNISASDLNNKYIPSLKLTINNNIIQPVRFTAQTLSITSTTNANTAYNNFSSGALIYTATSGPATVTITDQSVIKNILLYGIGISYTATTHVEYFNTSNFTVSYTISDTTGTPIVSNLSPSAITILANSAQTFSWAVWQEAGQTQTHYDLQYSYNEGVTWTTVANKQASTTSSRNIAANTFSEGIVTWRVRVYTVNGTISSDWAQTQIIVHINPSTSRVTVNNQPRPTVSWTSTGQTAYQVRIGDHDSGPKFGSATSYRSPIFFANGIYPVTIRTQSSDGTWSDWTETIYANIANSGSGSVSLTVLEQNNNAVLTWSTTTSVTDYLVLRNGVQIARTADRYYTDRLSNGENVYQVWGIRSTGYYVTSQSIMINIIPPCDVISLVDGIDWILLKYALNPLSRSYDTTVDVDYKYYAGRQKPVAATSGQNNRVGKYTYATRNMSLIQQLIAMTGMRVIHKDHNGDRIIGILNDVGYDSERVYSVTFAITEIDYDEEVLYT